MEVAKKMIIYSYNDINYNLIFGIVIGAYLIIRMSTACADAMTFIRGGIN